MGQALAQSATQLTVSPNGEASYDFTAAAIRCTSRKVKDNSLTRERHLIFRKDVISSVCADYRAHFAGIYGKSETLPSAIHEQILNAVDKHLESLLRSVNLNNCVSFRRNFKHKANQMMFVMATSVVGEDIIPLKEQLFACHLAQGALQRREEDLDKRNKLTDDIRKDIWSQRMKLNLTEQFIK